MRVIRQLPNMPKNTTHLMLSVGGNDALGAMGILNMKVNVSAEVFERTCEYNPEI